jgi:glucose-1-phosphate adenylyltransferase
MMRRARILAIIMAGGKGERLYPLTQHRSKPAVPFGGRYRIIDFVLSNFINSGIYSIYVLVQYLSQSLIEHLRLRWRRGGFLEDEFITVVPPQMRMGERWYRGTADAVTQNLTLIGAYKPDLVAIFGADHIYRMDINQMVTFHVEREADVTVAALPVPVKKASAFGVIQTDRDQRIVGFQEKPKRPAPVLADPTRAYASMGNYLFNTETLVEALLGDAARASDHDFGRTIIPELFGRARVYAFDFLTNEIPGLRDYEEPGYWRDVGSIEAYWEAHMDLLGETPRFELHNEQWPLLATGYQEPPARAIRSELVDCLVAGGSAVVASSVSRSVLGRGVRLEEGCEIEDSVIMDHTVIGKGARLKRVIVDRHNFVRPGSEIGFRREEDYEGFHVDRSGIVVLPRGGRG